MPRPSHLTRGHGRPTDLLARLGAAPRVAGVVLVLVASLLIGAPAPLRAQSSVDQQLDQVQQRASALRELDFTASVQRQFMSRDDLRAYNQEMFFRDVTPAELDASQTLLEIMGYVPQGYDTTSEILDVLGEEVLGFYDPETKRIYVVADENKLSPDDEVTFAHEMTHALQDQHYDLKTHQDALQNDNDAGSAYQALEEGDAVVNQTLYALQYAHSTLDEEPTDGEVSANSTLEQAPLIIQRELLFPYTEGADFIASAYLAGGWSAVDDIWANPPASTAQVIHPDKYKAGQNPIRPDLPDLAARLGDGWSEIDDDDIGELDLRTLIEQFVDRPTADRVASGWAGDHYKLLRRDSDGAVVFALRTVWESDAAAQAFVDAYQQVASGRHGSALSVAPAEAIALNGPAPDAAWEGQAGSYTHALVRDGANVALVIATDPAGATILDALRP